MIFANVLMNHFFVLSMQINGAAKATVYNFVVCYFASLFFGSLFFNEIINAQLLLGVASILTGTYFISMCQEPERTLK